MTEGLLAEHGLPLPAFRVSGFFDAAGWIGTTLPIGNDLLVLLIGICKV
ncbi:hypothetical protein [Peribacillus sp. SI8-4]|nr:hypothetical protein [Peribacillus sp. SI8-4]